MARLAKLIVGGGEFDTETGEAVAEPSEVATHRERGAANDGGGLETAIADREAMIIDREVRVVTRNEFAVDPPACHPSSVSHPLGPVATGLP